ncbi:PaaI family thioesterase [Aeromicrobium sp. 179-A 4D2 NHS]|uniref:PaaI family thioesterase n=1 Tax=Aeromicrobium sp. 179-A 4D2 NHS TaxID=3142375 RepID=UPI0039A0A1B2
MSPVGVVGDLERVRDLLARDAGAARHGIEVIEAADDEVVLAMTVRADMLNPGGTCHGGVLFLLGDTAVGQAASAAGAVVVTTSATITYLAPARDGDVLHAHARPVHDGGRSGVVDVEIRTAAGSPVALVRGHVLRPAPR